MWEQNFQFLLKGQGNRYEISFCEAVELTNPRISSFKVTFPDKVGARDYASFPSPEPKEILPR